MTHADIGAAKTIRDRAFSIVRGDSSELTRPKHRKEKSARPCGKRAEPGNLSNQDIKAAMS
jgi:putative transposase